MIEPPEWRIPSLDFQQTRDATSFVKGLHWERRQGLDERSLAPLCYHLVTVLFWLRDLCLLPVVGEVSAATPITLGAPTGGCGGFCIMGNVHIADPQLVRNLRLTKPKRTI